MRKFCAAYWPEIAFTVLAVLVLWQALLPGYVLLLDMIWTPHVYLQASHEGYWYLVPWQALLWLAHLVVPMWLIQKAVLLATVWLIPWSAYRFLPVPGGRLPRFIAGVFFLINPFVYTRFIAGHQLILVTYALLPLVLSLAIRAASVWRARDALFLGLCLALIGTLSPHMLVVAGLLAVCVGTAWAVASRDTPWKSICVTVAIVCASAAVASSYWLVPLVTGSERLDERFDREHLQAFSAASRPGFPLAADLLWLGGFWGEGREWSLQYRWPQDSSAARAAAAASVLLIAYGAVRSWRGALPRRLLAALLAAGAAGYVAASGLSLDIFAPLNEALFRLVPFWSGFRDSAKWVGLLAVPWAILMGTGFASLSAAWSARRRALAGVGVCLLVWVACYPMLPGFWGAVRPVWYPGTWEGVKAIIEADGPGERTLVLPWHRYYVNRLGGRLDIPAYFYFGPSVVTNRNPELGEAQDTETDPDYRTLDMLLRHPAASPRQVLQEFRRIGIVRVVLFSDFVGRDPLGYRFLSDEDFRYVRVGPGVHIYEVPEATR